MVGSQRRSSLVSFDAQERQQVCCLPNFSVWLMRLMAFSNVFPHHAQVTVLVADMLPPFPPFFVSFCIVNKTWITKYDVGYDLVVYSPYLFDRCVCWEIGIFDISGPLNRLVIALCDFHLLHEDFDLFGTLFVVFDVHFHEVAWIEWGLCFIGVIYEVCFGQDFDDVLFDNLYLTTWLCLDDGWLRWYWLTVVLGELARCNVHPFHGC